ncbi:hypothetical protein QTG56_25405 (plasmid) [Rossellomorea sp. AcN35-11]|nr:hypothetical protein [Rossellomorea aquimaris]WJV31954.1 hypothetical protein QTG56_25405 [Rossellomorea sp. AcN35-11]
MKFENAFILLIAVFLLSLVSSNIVDDPYGSIKYFLLVAWLIQSGCTVVLLFKKKWKSVVLGAFLTFLTLSMAAISLTAGSV